MLRLFKEAWLLARYGMFYNTPMLGVLGVGFLLYAFGLSQLAPDLSGHCRQIGVIIIALIAGYLFGHCSQTHRARPMLKLGGNVDASLFVVKISMVLLLSLLIFPVVKPHAEFYSHQHQVPLLSGMALYVRVLLMTLLLGNLVGSRMAPISALFIGVSLSQAFIISGAFVRGNHIIDAEFLAANFVLLKWDAPISRALSVMCGRFKAFANLWLQRVAAAASPVPDGKKNITPRVLLPASIRHFVGYGLAIVLGIEAIFYSIQCLGGAAACGSAIIKLEHVVIWLYLFPTFLFQHYLAVLARGRFMLLLQFYEDRRRLLRFLEWYGLSKIFQFHAIFWMVLWMFIIPAAPGEVPGVMTALYMLVGQVMMMYQVPIGVGVGRIRWVSPVVFFLSFALVAIFYKHFQRAIFYVLPLSPLYLWWLRKHWLMSWQTCNLAGIKQHV